MPKGIHSGYIIKHGHCAGRKNSALYEVWSSMKTRCQNSQSKPFKHYGARGIGVCERWLNSFENFLADMGPRPSGKYTLERINNDRSYEPGNCKWALVVEQARNRRNIKLSENFVQEIKLLYKKGYLQSEIAKKFGVRQSTISRVLNGKRWALNTTINNY